MLKLKIMIPQFPNFKVLTLEDKEIVESYTKKLPPYSDFNFTNLWAWNIDSGRKISTLNENLVILFTDYRTTEPAISFLGENKLEDTISTLLAYANDYRIEPQLKFIPETTIRRIYKEFNEINIVEDVTNHDYIFNVSMIADLHNCNLKSKCRLINKFLTNNPDVTFSVQKLHNNQFREQLLLILHRWGKNKLEQNKEFDLENEELAIKRLLETAGQHHLIISSLFIQDKMIAFSIDELLPNNYALSHFIKADITYKGIYEHLNQKVASYLEQCGVVYWNWEQDLNLEGLKRLKLSYRPCHFLKKYIITVKNKL